MVKAGVLALQGAFREHREALSALGVAVAEVRTAGELADVDALVIPGGESTTMTHLLDTASLREPLRAAIVAGLPVLGTCAGLIVLAHDVLDGRPDQAPLDVIDVTARRNAYGRQRDSFEADLEIEGLDLPLFRGVFIRAPAIERVGDAVDVLSEHNGRPVLAREGHVWVTTFHPELARDSRVHERFLEEVA
ncbi:MAG: pyridoxal 5'-phosphate synthase glutaminase subunit PdxT [Acidimicrobiia bacterium]